MLEVIVRLGSELLLPPFGPFLLLLTAFALRRRWRVASRALATAAAAGLWLLSSNGFAERMQIVSTPPAPIRAPYPAADAIVVLGGGRILDAPEYAGDTAGPSTLERIRYAAKLQRETGLPILVSGGRPLDLGQRSEAGIMRDILENEFDRQVRWVEAESTDTGENAERSAALLQADGVQRVLLVTHDAHMRRARAAFERCGLTVVPMATGFVRSDPSSPLDWLPTFRGLARNRAWLYERLALYSPL